MDVLERLTLTDVREGSLIACSHVHRYRLAAELCAELRVLDLCAGSGYGSLILAERATQVLGVDIDFAAMDEARRESAERENVEFEAGDALELLDADLGPRFDAIVMLEGLEHVADPERALAALRGHAERGMALVLSLPNGKTFREDNPHHVTDYDFEEAAEVFAGLPRLTLLHQFNAEGSLILHRGAEGPDARAELLDRAEPEYCNHVLAVSNLDLAGLAGADARMRLEVAPIHNRYILDLERENRALWEANARLSRDWLGRADSAAATRLAALEGRATVAGRLDRTLSERFPGLLSSLKAFGLRVLPGRAVGALRRLRSRGS